jgi:hypothetical protein
VYRVRAEAAQLATPRPVAAVAGTELALLSLARVTPDAAAKPYQVEARMEAAREAADAEVKLRLWREALAFGPADDRVRLGALRTALGLGRDSLALALDQGGAPAQPAYDDEGPEYDPRGQYYRYQQAVAPSAFPKTRLSDLERSALAESLAAAAERLDDLNTALSHLRTAIDLRPPGAKDAQRDALVRHLHQIVAEKDRRTKNAARQPVIKNFIEQDQRVRPRIPRSAQ